jgi:outer membrane protein assembly factor BamB
MKTKTLLASAAAVCLAPLSLFALDWPQWQGPDRTNISKETGLLKQWPEGGPKLLWTFKDAGMGYASPSIIGDRLYTMGARDAQDWVFAIDVKTAQQIWATPLGNRFNQDRGDGPRSTPTVAGDLLFALDGQGNLVCVSTEDGKKVWQKNLKTDLGGQMMSGWGYSESPLVDGDLIVCTPGGKDGAIAALDKKTGAIRWRSKGFTDAAGYSSLVVSEAGGVRQYVQLTGKSVVGVAAKDGRVLWRFAKNNPTAAIPTPICFDNFVYVSSGYGAGCALLKVGKDSSASWKADEVYANKNMVNHHGGVVHLGGHFYGYSDGKGWVCQDAKTGEVVWQERSRLPKGSLTCVEGQLYCYSQSDGTTVLVPASAAGWKESGRFKIPRQSDLPRPKSQRRDNIWTHPVVANGKLYLRDQDLLFCYDVSSGR